MRAFYLFESVLYLYCLWVAKPDVFGTILMAVVFILCGRLYYIGNRLSYKPIYVSKTAKQLRLMKQYEYGYGNCF